jgi:hypothetical protein
MSIFSSDSKVGAPNSAPESWTSNRGSKDSRRTRRDGLGASGPRTGLLRPRPARGSRVTAAEAAGVPKANGVFCGYGSPASGAVVQRAGKNVGGKRLRVVAFEMENAAGAAALRAASGRMAGLEVEFRRLSQTIEGDGMQPGRTRFPAHKGATSHGQRTSAIKPESEQRKPPTPW